ncbi:S8 family serine peptidase [Sphingomonas sp. 66-10]|uniref:S8 family serine peptidase n=1 Tax=Sphingomonas sp. 66-10 TaxID=1895848 RepID=UPI000AE46191|nr:S8 family serine peptidase [Sphingomonas sp. 66-10]
MNMGIKAAIKAGALALAIGMTAPAPAQLLGGGGLGNTLGGVTGGLTGGLLGTPAGPNGSMIGRLDAPLSAIGNTVNSLAPADLLSARRQRLRTLVRDNRTALDVDDQGNPIRRDEIIGINLAPDALAKAKAAGFTITRTEPIDNIGLTATILAPPRGKPARKAIEALRGIDPAGDYTLDHVYEPARAPLTPMQGPAAGGGATGGGGGAPIGLIDGGVGKHPAFANAAIEQRGFAGNPHPSGHGTAVASLLVGNVGAFRGAAPGSPLLVADVYGGAAGNGSAVAITRALAWLAQKGARVINISLVGPPNPLLAAGVKEVLARGIAVVAAVGNDGPAAPPQYPASYPGVVAVTGVDAKGHALIEAGKPLHLDFAAPGADMAGALPGGGWEALRGTSFAAPLVAGRLARAGSLAALAAEARPGSGRVGRGIVCGDCRTLPKSVGLK